ncbi:hypothetical protein Ancab_023249, partial [Ancistrocladus abbreviatus]
WVAPPMQICKDWLLYPCKLVNHKDSVDYTTISISKQNKEGRRRKEEEVVTRDNSIRAKHK